MARRSLPRFDCCDNAAVNICKNLFEFPISVLLAIYLGVEFLGYMGFPGGSDSKESACNEFSPWVGKISLEKGMATHSSILARRNPWIDELGGLQSMGLQRVGLGHQCFHWW